MSEESVEPRSFECPKCEHDHCEVGEVHAAGGVWSKVFDVEGRKFTTVTCGRCRYTELYQAEASTLSNIFDLFTN